MNPSASFHSIDDASPQPTRDQIMAAAFHLYVENGCREGRALDDWLRAEQLLTQRLRESAAHLRPGPAAPPAQAPDVRVRVNTQAAQRTATGKFNRRQPAPTAIRRLRRPGRGATAVVS
jgi:DUF2934 family protein